MRVVRVTRPAAPGQRVAPQHGDAEYHQDQRERRGHRNVVAALRLEEDLGGEGVVAEDLEGAVLGQQGQGHQDAPAEEGRPGLGHGHPAEGGQAGETEGSGHFLLAGVGTPKGCGHRQVDEGIEGQGHHQ